MSEKDGPISIEQWHRFGVALRQYADQGDWENVTRVNATLIRALTKAGTASCEAQRQARANLGQIHAQVLRELEAARDELSEEMKRFKQQQPGLAAYQLTLSSGAVDDI